MSKLSQGDIVHIEAVVEIVATDAVGVILKGANGSDSRVRVAKTTIRHTEPGPLKAGDTVLKTIGKKRVEGVIEHRSGDHAWVRFGDAHLVEPVEALARA